MKTLKEYLERNKYSIVKSLAELLSISEQEAVDFYKSLDAFQEGAIIKALHDGASDEERQVAVDLFSKYSGSTSGEQVEENDDEVSPSFDNVNDRYELGHDGKEYTITDHKTGEVIDNAWSGHEAHNLLTYWRAQGKKEMNEDGDIGADGMGDEEIEEGKEKKPDLNQMAGKAKVGGYDPARELSKGQYQHRVIKDKKKHNDRKDNRNNLKRGVYEHSIIPVITNDDGYKFKIVESSSISEMTNVEAIFESTIMMSPIGGLSAIPGVGMSSLRKMAGISQVEAEPVESEMTEIESPDVNGILSVIANMDDEAKACLLSMLSQPEAATPQIDTEKLAMVKTALCDFGCALQQWIEESNGGLDFLCPLVDALWVKYNEI